MSMYISSERSEIKTKVVSPQPWVVTLLVGLTKSRVSAVGALGRLSFSPYMLLALRQSRSISLPTSQALYASFRILHLHYRAAHRARRLLFFLIDESPFPQVS